MCFIFFYHGPAGVAIKKKKKKTTRLRTTRTTNDPIKPIADGDQRFAAPKWFVRNTFRARDGRRPSETERKHERTGREHLWRSIGRGENKEKSEHGKNQNEGV